MIRDEQAFGLFVEGDVGRIGPRQWMWAEVPMGLRRRAKILTGRDGRRSSHHSPLSFPSLEIVANKRRAAIKRVKKSCSDQEELDAGADRSKRRPGLRLVPGEHYELRHIFDRIEKTGDDYRPHEDAAHPGAAALPARRGEGVRTQRASERDTGDVDHDEYEIEREIEPHGPFVGVAPLFQNLRRPDLAPGELEAKGRRPHRRDQLFHELISGEKQNDRNDEEPRAHPRRHKAGWIPHTGSRSYPSRIAL